MKAPLPEVPPHVPKKRDFAKKPPLCLSVICGAQAIVFVLYIFLHTPAPEISRFWDQIVRVVGPALSLILVYYLWRGYSLARGIILWLTIASFSLLFFPSETTPLSHSEQILSHFDAILGVFLLIYLNLQNVKAHFAQRKTVELT